MESASKITIFPRKWWWKLKKDLDFLKSLNAERKRFSHWIYKFWQKIFASMKAVRTPSGKVCVAYSRLENHIKRARKIVQVGKLHPWADYALSLLSPWWRIFSYFIHRRYYRGRQWRNQFRHSFAMHKKKLLKWFLPKLKILNLVWALVLVFVHRELGHTKPDKLQHSSIFERFCCLYTFPDMNQQKIIGVLKRKFSKLIAK